jgi:hypothetical protein
LLRTNTELWFFVNVGCVVSRDSAGVCVCAGVCGCGSEVGVCMCVCERERERRRAACASVLLGWQ